MSNSMIRRWSKKILISTLFVASINIVEVFGVVMMMSEPTIQCPNSPDEGIITQPLPCPYNISSPIITVPKYRFFKNIPETEWTHAWLYEAEDLMVFATQGADEMMQSRFVIDENIDSTEVHLYAVIDGYGGNFTTEYLSYVLMDRLRNKISNIKKGNHDDHFNSYVYPNGSINYNKLLHDEIMIAEKDLWKKISESKDKGSASLSKSGSALLIAVLDTDRLYVANVGDSRALMSSPEGVATRLTEVHDYISNPKEKARVSNATSQHSWCHRPTISRAIGDFCYKGNAPYMIPDPQIFTYDLSKTHSKFILLATDWIWKGMGTISDEKKDQNIIKHVYEHFETYLLEAMINLSVRRHTDNIHGHSRAMIAVRTVLGKKKTTVRKKLIF